MFTKVVKVNIKVNLPVRKNDEFLTFCTNRSFPVNYTAS